MDHENHSILTYKYVARSGFSLIELAIFIAVAAVSITAFVAAIAPSAEEEAGRIAVTQEHLQEIHSAILAFRVLQNRLPCPARRDIAENDANYGKEDCAGVEETGARATDATPGATEIYNLGVVPVRTLGLSKDFWLDGWGRRFTYEVARAVCDVNPPPFATPDLRTTNTADNCTADTYANAADPPSSPTDVTDETYIIINTVDLTAPVADRADPANGEVFSNAIAYIALSHGVDGDGAWTPGGTQRRLGTASAATIKEIENVDKPVTTFGTPPYVAYNAAYLADRTYWLDKYTSEFDDMVIYGTKAQVELESRSIDKPVMMAAECDAMSQAFSKYDTSNIPNIGDTTAASNTQLLQSLWIMQEVCARYYPYVYDVDDDEKNDGGAGCDPLATARDDRCKLGGNRGYACPGGANSKGPDDVTGVYVYAKGFGIGAPAVDETPDDEDRLNARIAACLCSTDEDHTWDGAACN